MRAAILILIVAVVGLIVAIQTGLLDITQIRGARAPEISADSNGVTATGGQAPAFDVETGKVAVGSRDQNLTVKVPTVEVRRPAEANEATANSATN
jgi:hypothetical protein